MTSASTSSAPPTASAPPASHDHPAPQGHPGAGQHAATGNGDIDLRVGDHELVIRQRYAVVSIVNDVLIGIWFLIGSFLFFSDALMFAGTCLFVLGSVEMLIRPVIRLARHLHLRRIRPGAATESAQDF